MQSTAISLQVSCLFTAQFSLLKHATSCQVRNISVFLITQPFQPNSWRFLHVPSCLIPRCVAITRFVLAHYLLTPGPAEATDDCHAFELKDWLTTRPCRHAATGRVGPMGSRRIESVQINRSFQKETWIDKSIIWNCIRTFLPPPPLLVSIVGTWMKSFPSSSSIRVFLFALKPCTPAAFLTCGNCYYTSMKKTWLSYCVIKLNFTERQFSID